MLGRSLDDKKTICSIEKCDVFDKLSKPKAQNHTTFQIKDNRPICYSYRPKEGKERHLRHYMFEDFSTPKCFQFHCLFIWAFCI